MYYQQFYSELGKLLYAIAAVDGVISPKEKEALRALVRKQLAPAETHTDKFGTDAANYVDIEFDILEDAGADVEASFASFINFVEAHHTAIDKRMRDAALAAAKQVANAFKHTGHKEGKLLLELERKLGNLPLP